MAALERLIKGSNLDSGISKKWTQLIHSCLVVVGLMSSVIIYKIVGVDNSKVWPLALGAFLSVQLPIAFSSIQNKSIRKGYFELVGSNYSAGQGSFRSSLISVNLYLLAVSFLVIWVAYQTF